MRRQRVTPAKGRGLHLYWLLEPFPAQTLPIWQAVQDRLVEALAPLGADPMVCDCTRVLRIVGSVNSNHFEQIFWAAACANEIDQMFSCICTGPP